MQCLNRINLKIIYLCQKCAIQTTSEGGQKWISKHTIFYEICFQAIYKYLSKTFLGNKCSFNEI